MNSSRMELKCFRCFWFVLFMRAADHNWYCQCSLLNIDVLFYSLLILKIKWFLSFLWHTVLSLWNQRAEFTSVTVCISEAIRAICCYDTWLGIDGIEVLSKALLSPALQGTSDSYRVSTFGEMAISFVTVNCVLYCSVVCNSNKSTRIYPNAIYQIPKPYYNFLSTTKYISLKPTV
jgi:hypothetical protein